MKKAILISIIAICYFSSFSQETGTFTDNRDGHVYKTVKIGNQVFMTENLTYKPVNGNYWAYNNNESNLALYGYLYDWETAQKICPNGWLLPFYSDYEALLNNLGGKGETALIALLPGGATGFSSSYGGWCNLIGNFDLVNSAGGYWTSSYNTNSNEGYYLAIRGYKKSASIESYNKKAGFSVRCLNTEFGIYSLAKSGTFKDCDDYIKNYPNGKYLDEIKNIRKQKYSEEENELYSTAKNGTFEDCDAYLSQFPNGQYIEEITKLRKEKYNSPKNDTKDCKLLTSTNSDGWKVISNKESIHFDEISNFIMKNSYEKLFYFQNYQKISNNFFILVFITNTYYEFSIESQDSLRIIFSDGSEANLPPLDRYVAKKITVSGYKIESFYSITHEQLKEIRDKKITAIEISFYNNGEFYWTFKFKEHKSEKFSNMANCILENQ